MQFKADSFPVQPNISYEWKYLKSVLSSFLRAFKRYPHGGSDLIVNLDSSCSTLMSNGWVCSSVRLCPSSELTGMLWIHHPVIRKMLQSCCKHPQTALHLWVGLSKMCLSLPPFCLRASSGPKLSCCSHHITCTSIRLHRLGFLLTLRFRSAFRLPSRDPELCWDRVWDEIHPPE